MRLLHVVAASAATALLITGCSSGGGSGSTEAGGESAEGSFELVLETPAGTSEVEKVNWGIIGGESTTLDPIKVGTEANMIPLGNMCEALFTLNPDFSTSPNVAESGEWVDETTYVITLRDGVQFWDGSPVTAEDIVYSFERGMDPEKQSVVVSAFTSVTDVTATSDSEVTVKFSEPNSDFPNSLASHPGAVIQKAFIEEVGDEAVGTAAGGLMCTGPFELTDWTPGGTITMTKNENYWNGAPLVNEIEFHFVADDTTLTSALLAGELDGAFNPAVSAMAQLENASNGTAYVGPSTASLGFGPASADNAAADPKVREALDLAIDKDAVVSAVLNGYGAPVKTFTVPFAWEGMEAHEIYREGYDALPDNSYDLERAKEIMSEVDIADETLVLAVTAGEQAQLQAATIIQSSAKEIGLDIEIKQMQGPEFGQIFYDPAVREGVDFVLTTGYVDTPGVLLYAEYFALSDGLFNWSEWDNAEATELLRQARAETDPFKSAESFVAAQAIYGPERLKIELAQEYARSYLSDELTGIPTSFSYIFSPWALHLGGK